MTLWQTSPADGRLFHGAVASVDGSVWVVEEHLATDETERYSTVAVYERGGRLRWRSDPVCDAGIAGVFVGADAVGALLLRWPAESGDERSWTVMRMAARDGAVLGSWVLPGGVVSLSGQSERLVFFTLATRGVTASCRGARALWTRSRPGHREWTIFGSPNATDRSWLHGGTDPTELDPNGAILRTLERPALGAPTSQKSG